MVALLIDMQFIPKMHCPDVPPPCVPPPQVLVSLQSMVLVEDPYFNEPGYERSASTAAGKKAAADYNAAVRLWALMEQS